MENLVGTLYARVEKKEGTAFRLVEWMEHVRDGYWQRSVEYMRQLLAEGKTDEAAKVKAIMPAIMVAGKTQQARKPEFLTDRTGICMFDADHIDGDAAELERLKQQVMDRCPWVWVAHVTASGHGLRFYGRLGEVHLSRYREAYGFACEALQKVLGYPLDGQCKDVCRVSFPSYDPHLLMRKSFDEVELFREYPEGFDPFVAAEDAGQRKGKATASEVHSWDTVPVFAGGNPASDTSEDAPVKEDAAHPEKVSAAEGSESADDSEKDEGGEHPEASEEPDDPASSLEITRSPRDIRLYLERFLMFNPFVKGERNKFLLALGRRARYEGFTWGDMLVLARMTIEKLASGDITDSYIRQRLKWGFEHSSVGEQEGDENPTVPVSKSHLFHYRNVSDVNSSEASENEEDEEMMVANTCPLVPDWVYDLLPDLLTRGLVAARSRKLKDVLLLAMLTNISACLPGVRMLYSGRKYSPHLFSMILGQAGGGKGVMNYAARLTEGVQRDFDAEYNRNAEIYKRQHLMWTAEQQRAFREKREPDWEKDPGEAPRRKIQNLSATISQSQLILTLKDMDPEGPVMNATEIEELSNAVGSDYGKHSPILRKLAMQETVGQNFKVDGRPIRVRNAKLSLCITGTDGQGVVFIPSPEDGMLSRFLILIFTAEPTWFSAAPDDNNTDMDELFDGLAEEVRYMYRFLKEYPTDVHFTREQWKEHTGYFSRLMDDVSVEGNMNAHSIVVRYGMQVSRLAMVLTAIRKFKAGMTMKDVICTDEDFQVAMEMAKTWLMHSLQLSTILPEKNVRRRKMTSFFGSQSVLDSLPKKFVGGAFVAGMMKLGKSRSAAYRVLKNLVRNEALKVKRKSGIRYYIKNAD